MTGAATKPSESITPPNVDALRALVQDANEGGTSLVVTSSGGPHFKDGLACAEPHRLVDLSSWKRVEASGERGER